MRGGSNLLAVAFALFFAAPFAGNAAAQTVQRVDVSKYGTFFSEKGIDEQPTRQGIERQRVPGAKHLETARTIIAQIGTQFGFRYRLVGTPSGAPLPIRIVAKFPAPGVMGKNNPKPVLQDDYYEFAVIGREDFLTWTFEKRTDLVPGIWSFEIWSGNRKLADEKFNIVLPPIS
jgi:hypothetical protein